MGTNLFLPVSSEMWAAKICGLASTQWHNPAKH